MRDLVLWLARELVDHKDAVKVDAIERDRSTRVRAHGDPDDLGRVIGRGGRTAKALRTVLDAAARKGRPAGGARHPRLRGECPSSGSARWSARRAQGVPRGRRDGRSARGARLDRAQARRGRARGPEDPGGAAQGRIWALKVEGVPDRTAAEALVGSEVLAEREELGEAGDDKHFWTDLEGLQVVTTAGVAVGTVTGLYETGGVDVLVVTGEGGEKLVPLAPYVEVDVAGKRIVVDPPEGLLDG